MKHKALFFFTLILSANSFFAMYIRPETILEPVVKKIAAEQEISLVDVRSSLSELQSKKKEMFNQEVEKQLEQINAFLQKEKTEKLLAFAQEWKKLDENPITGGVYLNEKKFVKNLTKPLVDLSEEYKNIKKIQQLCAGLQGKK